MRGLLRRQFDVKRLTVAIVLGFLLGAVGRTTAAVLTKYQQIRADLAALAQYHEDLANGNAATPEIEQILRDVTAAERALVDKEY